MLRERDESFGISKINMVSRDVAYGFIKFRRKYDRDSLERTVLFIIYNHTFVLNWILILFLILLDVHFSEI